MSKHKRCSQIRFKIINSSSIYILPMYNYQTYLKEQEISRKFDQIHRQYQRTTLHRQKSNPTLVHSHKKRIQGFILSVIDKPIPVSQYSNHPHSYREEDKSKNIGSNAFYLKHENQQERIKETQRKNSELDDVPFRNTFSHRFRQSDKLLKPMKYKPINHNFRVKEYVDSQTLNYLPNYLNQKVDRIIHRSEIKNRSQRESLNKTINKSLLPFLHTKTYFKSVQTLFAQLPKQRKGEFGHEKQLVTQESYEDTESQIKRENKKNNDHLSRKENSREALMKCNMLIDKEKRNEKIFINTSNDLAGPMRI